MATLKLRPQIHKALVISKLRSFANNFKCVLFMRILASPQFYLKVVKRLITASNLSSMHGSYYDIEFKPLFPFNTLNLQRLLSNNLER